MESVIVSDFGAFLGKTSERLVVRGPRPHLELVEGGPQLLLPLDLPLEAAPELKVIPGRVTEAPQPFTPGSAPRPGKGSASGKGPILTEIPLFRLTEVIVATSGVSISSDLVEECCERGIRISFLDWTGRPYAMLSSPMLTATVITRRKQLAAYNDQRGVELAKAIVRGKLTNQANLLKYFGKYLKQSAPERHAGVAAIADYLDEVRGRVDRVTGANVGEVRPTLMGMEGTSGRQYWEGVKVILADHASFEGREHRGAADEVNAALNYGYGILYAQVWGAIMNAGLEPFAGFLHVDRPGKPSMVLDLIEEFRQPIVDRAVIAFVNKGSALELRKGFLQDDSKRALAAKVLEQLDTTVTFRGKRHRLRSIIQMQARAVASHVRGDGVYRPFAWKW